MENMIPHIRREKKVKQVDLARALDVSPSYLCKIEKGLQEPTEKFINGCAEFFNVSVEELFPLRKKKESLKKINEKFTNRLWSTRTEKGIKQYELAKVLNCSPSYLSKVEKGLQQPNNKFRKKCARILKVKETELFPDGK
ncbi:MAG: transcriptional regulator [Spirochaetae bacterium HGW-Spirochaetae-1]|nr:MAG: transcriptional regulator [Spirochaetae bacterium HGW-Spirochaetae-1]